VVLHIGDTTTLSFDHPHTQGLGPPGAGGGGQGMLLHNTLAVDVSGGIDAAPRVLGLTHQQLWTRTNERGKTPESAKWSEAIEAIGPAPQGVSFVHVSDAESDCWEALAAAEAQGVGHVIRACQDRLVRAGDDPHGPPTATLFDLVRARPALGGKYLWVRARGNEEARLVKLLVSATQVTLHPPKNWAHKAHRAAAPRPRPLVRWAVRVWEAQAPEGREPIEWVLLTDRPIGDLQAALLIAFWYSCRWLVEEYHKCLKSGCGVEKRQLEHVDRLEPLVGVLSVVAVRLLQLKHQARVNPDTPASDVVPEPYVRTLAAWLKISANMTARQFWRGTAQLGGFLGRKGDGDPGWQTLWQGWWKLQLLTDGAELARRMR
jgi:Transposase Tn5 dimerisation domain